MSRFLYHTKDHLAYISEKKNDWWEGNPFCLKCRIGAKSLIFSLYIRS